MKQHNQGTKVTTSNKLYKVDQDIRETKKRLAVLLNRKIDICNEVIQECEKDPLLFINPMAIKEHRQWDIEATTRELARIK